MLDLISSTNKRFPAQKMLIYGVQGIGKNTFASTFKSPILLQTEDGSEALDMQAFPVITDYTQICEAINALHGEHNFKTLVVDTLDWMERHVWAACCAAKGWESIEQPGYGRGYIELDKWWQHIMTGLDSLRMNKNMDIILLAHSDIKRVEPPDTDPYDCYQIKMQKRAFSMWQEWASTVLFLNYKINVQKTKTGINEERTRGTGSGDRVIYTTERPAWKAKSRWPLPDEILIGKDKTWAAFHDYFEQATEGKYVSPYTQKEI